MRGVLTRMRATVLLVFDRPGLFALLHRQPWYGGMLREWATDAGAGPGRRVLEIGCGPGLLAVDLARAGARVHATDRSAAMLRAAGRTARRAGVDVAVSAEVPPGPFDVVLAASVVNVVADPVAFVATMAAAARPGGSVSFLVPGPGMARMGDVAATLDASGASLLRMWGSRARRIDDDRAVSIAGHAGLVDIVARSYLDGCVLAVTGRR